ncbi:MAG: terpene cyclase/mutase family protein [Planctomycetia bacterium]|nr:terpene cyclase/mutase family protein [Planctomycetia bacterium]
MNDNPLLSLTLRLHQGMGHLPEELRKKARAFILSRQDPRGGFIGRRGKADIYYTSFALRALTLLGLEKDSDQIRLLENYIGQFLSEFLQKQKDLSSAELHSFLFSVLFLEGLPGTDPFKEVSLDRKTFFQNALDKLQRKDGGFASSVKSAFSEIYHTFLAISAFSFLGIPLPEKNRAGILQLLRKNRREDGGFSEMEKLRSSGTNPTAAAIMIVRALSGSEEIELSSACRFLWKMQIPEGGFRANSSIPAADLLSTFTALAALWDPKSPCLLAPFQEKKIREFTESLQTKEGGFRAAFWDKEPDIEYTFYGLALLSLLDQDQAGMSEVLGT